MSTDTLHDVLTNCVGTNTVLQGRALSTQESHRHLGAFRPYVYRGTGQDTITGTKPPTQAGKPHPDWCYCNRCARNTIRQLHAQNLTGTTALTGNKTT